MKTDSILNKLHDWQTVRCYLSAASGTLAHSLVAIFAIFMIGLCDPAAAQQSGTFTSGDTAGATEFGTVVVKVGIIRQAPDVLAPALDRVYRGESVQLLKTEGDWFRIRLGDGSTGWAHQSLITPSGPPKQPLVDEDVEIIQVQVKRGLFRQSPSPDAEILGRFYRGDRLKLLERAGDWVQIELPDGRTAWSHQSVFDVTFPPPTAALDMPAEPQPEPKAATTADAPAAVAPETDDIVQTTPTPSPTPTPIATAAAIAEPTPTPTAPVAADTAPEPQPTPVPTAAAIRELVVTVPTGRVRQSPSLTAPILFNLNQGNKATLLDTQGKWYHLKTSDGRTGWAHRMLFDPKRQTLPTESGGISAIRFVATGKGDEKVLILLDRLAPPKTDVREGSQPQVICSFDPGRLGKGVEPVIDANGEHIRRIRVHGGQDLNEPLQVIIDLAGTKPSYQVKPVYFERQQLYTLTIDASS